MVLQLSKLRRGAGLSADDPMAALSAIPRPSYCLAGMEATAASPATTTVHAVFLDGEFRRLGHMTGGALQGAGGHYETWNNAQLGGDLMFGGRTHTAPGANTTETWPHATNSSSEFGNDCGFFASERGLINNNATRVGGNFAHRAGFAFVNSDHADRTRVLQFDSGQLVVNPLWSPRVSGLIAPVRPDRGARTPTPVAGSQLSNMIGSASYNAVRRELVVVSANSSGTGRYDVYLWSGVDFDANGLDVAALPAVAPVTFQVDVSGLSAMTGFDNETRFRANPVLCDDGSIFLIAMFPSAALRAYRIVRPVGDALATVTLVGEQALTTSYGLVQGQAYGLKSMQTRDAGMVLAWCPYANYGAGIASWAVDKRSSTCVQGPLVTDGTVGYNIVKYRDDAFAFYYAQTANGVAAWTQGLVNRVVSRRAGAAPLVTTGSIFMPIFPSGSSFFWALTHVWEYNLQTNLLA